QQSDTVLILHFALAAKGQLVVNQVGGNILSVVIAPPHPATSAGVVATGADMPRALDPAPGEDGFEIVPLKYADVSEVVGLLTDGLTVKSNDSFVPHEPAFGSAGINGSGFQPAPNPNDQEAAGDPLGQSVNDSIAVDRRLNAIILKGPPERIA